MLPSRASRLITKLPATKPRLLHITPRRLETPTNALPAARPVGAFRGGFIGFLLGSSAGAYGCYYYLYEDYRRSNDLLNEDMYALQAAVTRLTGYVTSLEEKVETMQGNKRR